MTLSNSQRERYSRQIMLEEINEAGQEKLLSARVLVVGAGGLGSPAALYLAAAGVGCVGIIDPDKLDISNLQRQVIHSTKDIGRPKVISAKETLEAINPDCNVVPIEDALNEENAEAILNDYDFVIDATDNFTGKFLIASACHKKNKPYSHAGIFTFFGQTITVIPGKTACYCCVFEEPAPDCGLPRGPLGAVPGVIGSIQATEAIKYVTGCGDLLVDRMFIYDALTMSFRTVMAKRNPECPLCSS